MPRYPLVTITPGSAVIRRVTGATAHATIDPATRVRSSRHHSGHASAAVIRRPRLSRSRAPTADGSPATGDSHGLSDTGADGSRHGSCSPGGGEFPGRHGLRKPSGSPGTSSTAEPAVFLIRRLIGPSIVQIGTEGGFLPAPVVWPNIPIGFERNPKNIVVGKRPRTQSLPGTGRAGGYHHRLLAVRRQDDHPLQRLPRGRPGGRQSSGLLHRRPGPDRRRRHAPTLPGLRSQHPHHHAVPGGGGRSSQPPPSPTTWRRCRRRSPRPARDSGRLCEVAGPDHRAASGLQHARTTRLSPEPGSSSTTIQSTSLTFNPLDLSTPAP